MSRIGLGTRSDPGSHAPIEGVAPRVWLLMGFRAGDNAQVAALADALGWPCEIKRLAYRKYEFVTNRLLGPTLAGVDRTRSDSLAPPWPDLVITAGRRNEPVARWIQRRAPKRTRLVHLGRPWAPVECFDLVVTTPQYQVPERPNVLQIAVPLHAMTPRRLSDAAARWHGAFEPFPRPWTAVLVGGDSPPYVFDAEAAGRLGRGVADLARRHGGTLLVATSPRTGRPAAEALRRAIGVPCHFYDWRPDPNSNPYVGYLALADSIVVTGESMSMIAEACATAKPVYLFDMGRGWTRMRPPGAAGEQPEPLTLLERLQPKRMLHWLLAHGLPTRIRRDVRRMLSQLVASGHARWLGDSAWPANPLPPDDLARAVARTRELF